uniref:uncharacterized protein LOC120885703 n=1 Tax=Ictidomys tridecemlineatus TaxID=43179 RepID=UPI001A9CE08A|nr:uncharacterized protein LOC120885703 [Ictidomys tridecemlineatus]
MSTKTEEAGLEDVPQSQMVSKDVHASYKNIKPTIKSKDTALKKQKWWKREKKQISDSQCHMSSEKLKESVDGMEKSHGQSVSKKSTEVCASSVSSGSYTQANNGTKEHGEDAEPVSSSNGKKGKVMSTKTEEAGLEDVPQSQMGDFRFSSSYLGGSKGIHLRGDFRFSSNYLGGSKGIHFRAAATSEVAKEFTSEVIEALHREETSGNSQGTLEPNSHERGSECMGAQLLEDVPGFH